MTSIHLLLLLVFLCTCFGPGFQQVGILVWPLLSSALFYVRSVRACWILPLYISLSLGGSLAYLGIFNDPYWTTQASLVVAVQFIGNIALLVPLLIDRLFIRRFGGPAHLIVFPSAFSAVFFVVSLLSPLGSWGSFAFTALGVPSLAHGVSLGGLSLINFFLGFGASVTVFCASQVSRWAKRHAATWTQVENTIEVRERLIHEHTFRRPFSGSIGCHPVSIFLYVFFFLSIYGSARVTIFGGTFYQRSVNDFAVSTQRVSCVVGRNTSDPWGTHFRLTEEALIQGSKMVIWAETAVNVYSEAEINQLINTTSQLARQYQAYIGITYEWINQQIPSPNQKNMLALIDKNGTVAFRYQKAHPVMGVESDVVAGPGVIPFVDTKEFGRIGGAICFDLDFPSYIGQAGRAGVDLMLQPAWTWGPIPLLAPRMNALRAVEQGFTLFRCSSFGESGVYSPFLDVYASKTILDVGTMNADIPIRKQTVTLYSLWGEAVGYLCCVVSLVSVLLLCVPFSILARLPASVLNFFAPGRSSVGFYSSGRSTDHSTFTQPLTYL